ncbi:MAG: hypothetical protein WCP96_22555 [Methylococcaceae bacterium]
MQSLYRIADIHYLYPVAKTSEWMRYECHPWRLDPGTNRLEQICIYPQGDRQDSLA